MKHLRIVGLDCDLDEKEFDIWLSKLLFNVVGDEFKPEIFREDGEEIDYENLKKLSKI